MITPPDSLTLTHLGASAAHASSVPFCALHSSVGTSTSVLSKAQVVVGAHVDDALRHFARVPEAGRQKPQITGLLINFYLVKSSLFNRLPGTGSKLINRFSDDISDTQSWRNHEIHG